MFRFAIDLYRNVGAGRFEEVVGALPLRAVGGRRADIHNPVWIDYDEDGDPDLFIAGLGDDRLFRNDGSAGFADVTAALIDPVVSSHDVFSAAAADFDQDGHEDLFLGRWDGQCQRRRQPRHRLRD
ncbi:VCBS repeat-containing protein [bacterium]|nr:VCBS repeat-containing protein [bacterium]NCQ62146.1 VCBS repeat-containing protein [Myxococcales bacterium]